MDPFLLQLTAMILFLLTPAFMPIIVPVVSWIGERISPAPATRRTVKRTPHSTPAAMITLPAPTSTVTAVAQKEAA